MIVPRHTYPNGRRRLRQGLVVLLCFGLVAYFAHHTLHGRHGFEARQRLIDRSNIVEFEIESLEAVRSRLERDVALLAPELPHPDLVEEIARDVLGYAHPDDHMLPPL